MKMLFIIFLLLPTFAWCADQIQGNACYTYGDNESLVQGDQMARTLAIRNALESYSVFIASTTQVKDLQLSSDLISSVSAGVVKEVKVLKRLESGRKICYTIQGFVNPDEVKTAIKEYLEDKNSDVRVKDNGWLRIIDEFLLKKTPEEFFEGELNEAKKEKDAKSIERWEKGIREKTEAGKIYRFVYVKIEFLKPCKATMLEVKYDDVIKKFKTIGDIKDSLDEEDPFFGLGGGIKFRCDYRLKVFATFYSKNGVETGTYNALPPAEFINGVIKDVKVPGERMWMSFFMPENAESWKIWVPK